MSGVVVHQYAYLTFTNRSPLGTVKMRKNEYTHIVMQRIIVPKKLMHHNAIE